MRQNWKWAWIVARKELLEGLRDRRSVMAALIMPLFGPLMMVFTFNTVAERQRDAVDLPVHISGGEYAPHLVEWFEQRDVEVHPGPDNPKEAVRNGEVPAVLVVPEDYAATFASGESVELQLVYDGARLDTQPQVGRLRGLANAYSRHMGNLRLIVRGVSPELAQPLRVEDADLASRSQRSVVMLSFIPIFVVLAAFLCGANLAIDISAGERERRSLEPLLVNPVSRRALVAGKWLACVVFACVGTGVTLVCIGVALTRLPLAELGLRLNLGPVEVIGVLAAVLPLAFLASGLQLLVSTFARSFKEAQTYISLLIFAPMLPTLVDALSPIGRQDWMAWVPILGQHVLLKAVLGGEQPALWVFSVAGVVALFWGLVCAGITARLFFREKIIFGR